MEKLKLYGFNNLTKTLSFNIYDICYAVSSEDKQEYIEYIDEQYNSARLTEILKEVTRIIGANILNIAKQDYEPQGASVNLLIAEEKLPNACVDPSCNGGEINAKSKTILGHLDTSHITVHTYPEYHPDRGIMTFRVDIDVSTCGKISPLKALDYLIEKFDSDIIICDYRIRGFTRDVNGGKHFKDHEINSIKDFISKRNLDLYNSMDINMHEENIFHTKMMVKDFKLDNYLFKIKEEDLTEEERRNILTKLNKEMHEIYYGRNF
ncbi:adenosylmethionine decarboxylase [Paratissierella segnis]|uniref:S-adenosylmethionine decarboxylase proenzyme n=1 Tax=Paratissierella segnis TaxID=2763679 RepID=A0A926IF07_9FIRM|nr:adenosylmethionine decarboxylase [Paratissierella segnis]MBC8587967.1 adenosylmethionine decarboxylase [Paratissierella segnis]